MKDKSDILKKLDSLVIKRDRIGKKALTIEQRKKMLNQIYDSALFWLQGLVTAGKPGGIGAATTLLMRAREELVAWENEGVSKQDHVLTFDIPDLDFSAYNEEKKAAAEKTVDA